MAQLFDLSPTGPEKSLVALLCTLGFVSHFDDEAMQQAGALLKVRNPTVYTTRRTALYTFVDSLRDIIRRERKG